MMRKKTLFIVLMFLLCSFVFSEQITFPRIVEFSDDYYPDIFFTLETNQQLDQNLLTIDENENEVSSFDFREEVVSEQNRVEFLIVSEYSQKDLMEGRYLFHEKLLELKGKIESIHDNVTVKFALFDGNHFVSESDDEQVLSNLSGLIESETDGQKVLNLDYSVLSNVIIPEFDRQSAKKYILYFSGYSRLLEESSASYIRYAEFELFREAQKKLGVQSFLCNESLLNTSDDFLNMVYKAIADNAYNFQYTYYIGYRMPLALNLSRDHTLTLEYSDDTLIEHDYQLNYSADKHLILDLNTADYPMITFSYYKDGKTIEKKDLIVYENYKKNQYFGKTEQKNNELDIVFVIEDTYFSKFYNAYLLNALVDFVSTLRERGYSLRIGLVSYSNTIAVNHALSYNTDAVLSSFGKNTYYSNGFDFYSALDAVMKASEMSFLSNASKNIIFFQAEDTVFFDENKKVLPESVEKALLDRNINFFSFTNHPFFEELNYRVPGNTIPNPADLSVVLDYLTGKNDFDFYSMNTEPFENSDLILFDSGRLIRTSYLIGVDDIKSEFKINSITASPFIARRGEEVRLNCRTDPVKDVTFVWTQQGEEDSKNFKNGNEKRTVTWIAPMEKGYYTISVKASYRNYSLEGEVVVLVE